MKPRNREVNIFNMSVLDLLTGALGAFCFLTLALFPYYFKAQNASAGTSNTPANAADLKADNESLKKQIEAEKSSGKQMPPFVLMSLSSYFPDTGNNCATLVLKGVTPPEGAPAIGYRAGGPTPGGRFSNYYLFLQRVGEYQFEVDAAPTSAGNCHVIIDVEGIAGNNQEKVITSPQILHFDYQITGDDFPASLFD
jgi:hypothetical protein